MTESVIKSAGAKKWVFGLAISREITLSELSVFRSPASWSTSSGGRSLNEGDAKCEIRKEATGRNMGKRLGFGLDQIEVRKWEHISRTCFFLCLMCFETSSIVNSWDNALHELTIKRSRKTSYHE